MATRILISIIILILSCLTTDLFAVNIDSLENGSTFKITLQEGDVTVSLRGISDFSKTPSSYSIYMKEENGSCAIHLLNFKTPPGKGTYNVADRENLTTGAVCMLENVEKRERLSSESGTFIITDLSKQGSVINGQIDMIMIGNSSGKKYRLKGVVESTLIQ